MGILAGLFFVAIALAAATAYAIHAGAGPRLQAFTDVLKADATAARDFVVRQYYDVLVPIARVARFLSLGLVGFAAVTAAIALIVQMAGPSPVYVGTLFILAILALAAVSALVVVRTGQRGYFASGRSTIPVGGTSVNVVFPVIGRPPVIRVDPFDKSTDFQIRDVTDTGFTIEYIPPPPPPPPAPPPPAAAPAPCVFNWAVRESEGLEPVIRILSHSFWTVLSMAALVFVTGVTVGNRGIVMLCVPLTAFAVTLFFEVWHVFSKSAELFVDAAEFLPNSLFAVVMAVFTKKTDKVEAFFQRQKRSTTQAVNLANQEDFERVRASTRMTVVATIVTFVLLAILLPTWKLMTAMALAECAGVGVAYLYECRIRKLIDTIIREGDQNRWPALEEARCKLDRLYARSLVVYSAIVMVLAGAVIAMVLVPGMEAMLDTLLIAVNAWLRVSALCLIANLKLVLIIAALAVGLFFLWPRSVYAPLRRTRKFAAVPVGAGLLGCLIFLFWSLASGPAEAAVRAEVFERTAPKLSLTDKPSVRVSWNEYPGASGYRIEWRKPSALRFYTVRGSTLPASFVSFEDAVVKRGETYIYRVVAETRGGDVASEPSEIRIPPAAQTSPKPTVTPPHPPPPPKKKGGGSKCAGGCGMSPELAELCRMFPASCR